LEIHTCDANSTSCTVSETRGYLSGAGTGVVWVNDDTPFQERAGVKVVHQRSK
jgi:hypothetical protein